MFPRIFGAPSSFVLYYLSVPFISFYIFSPLSKYLFFLNYASSGQKTAPFSFFRNNVHFKQADWFPSLCSVSGKEQCYSNQLPAYCRYWDLKHLYQDEILKTHWANCRNSCKKQGAHMFSQCPMFIIRITACTKDICSIISNIFPCKYDNIFYIIIKQFVGKIWKPWKKWLVFEQKFIRGK
jgi:hypothetical protein